MKPSFGEGWLAFGHVLTAESEHEQATNCYLRVYPLSVVMKDPKLFYL